MRVEVRGRVSGRVAVIDMPNERAVYLVRLGVARPVETATNEQRERATLPRPVRR